MKLNFILDVLHPNFAVDEKENLCYNKHVLRDRKEGSKMKAMVVVCLVVYLVGMTGNISGSLYPRTAFISELDYEKDIVTVTDCVGYDWQFYGCEDWEIGDMVSMIMSDNGTPNNIKDDIIVDCQYGGYNMN